MSRQGVELDYYQSLVTEYLRADRSTFVNTEFCIQLDSDRTPKDRHWFCDAVALECSSKTVFPCEVSFAEGLGALLKRLRAWQSHWPELCAAVVRDASLTALAVGWEVRPWLFIPAASVSKIEKNLPKDAPFRPRVTTLEMVQPWNYRSWNRSGEKEKLDVPDKFRT